MKTRPLALALFALVGRPVFAATTTASLEHPPLPDDPATDAQRLVVTVDVPRNMYLFRHDDAARAIADDIQLEFRRSGYRGEVDYDRVASSSKPSEPPRLAITLVEWRVSPTRMFECTFTADLVTAQGTKPLGVFSGTALRLAGLRNAIAHPDGFDEAARHAIDDLYHTLCETKLPPEAGP